MKNTTKYLSNKMSEHDHWWYQNTDAVQQMMDDCDVKKEELPPGLWEAAERGPVLHMQDTDEIIPVPETEEEQRDMLRRLLRQRKAWNRIDEHACHLLDAAEDVKRIHAPNGIITILAMHKEAPEELIADGLWTGNETRIRITPIGERHEQTSSYTIWYADGTIQEWSSNDCCGTIKKEQTKTLEAIRYYA